MPWLHSLIYLLPDLWRSVTRRPTTTRFPFGPAELPACFRGKVTIDSNRCRGCEACVRDCPTKALELERESREVYRLIYHHDRCAYCGQCEISCPFDAIAVTNDFASAATERESLREVFAKEGSTHNTDPSADSAQLQTKTTANAEHG